MANSNTKFVYFGVITNYAQTQYKPYISELYPDSELNAVEMHSEPITLEEAQQRVDERIAFYKAERRKRAQANIELNLLEGKLQAKQAKQAKAPVMEPPTLVSAVRPPLPLAPGVIAEHDDGIKSHLAIVVSMTDTHIKAVFLTSKAHWGNRIRRATKEELALLGFVYTRTTYLSGVTRLSSQFTPTADSFPSEYIESYSKEFDFDN